MWIALIVIGVGMIVTAVLLTPRGRSADDRRLPTDVETRILLGEDPDVPEPPPASRHTAPQHPDRREAS
jgi:hypothetical protein